MSAVDLFVPLREWRESLYRGDAKAIDSFLDRIDKSLSPGWVRDLAYERTRLRPDRIRCYLFDQPTDAAVRVWLQRVTATRVRGGAIQVLSHPPSGDATRIGQLVKELAVACVLSAASAAGVNHTRPTFGPRSAVTPTAGMQFIRFADATNGNWPFNDKEQVLWDALVSACLVEQVAIDRAELERWLAASGWEQGIATQIAGRFFADSESLAKRLAVTGP